MNAGELTELITIRARGAGKDAARQPSGAWGDVGTEWASRRQLNGLESIRAGAVSAVVQASYRIRWRASGTYTTAMRVVHDGVVYGIKAVSPDLAGRQYVDLVCESIPGEAP